MKKKLVSIIVLVVLTLALILPVCATGNEWIYDEPQVISTETENYIKTLNEEVFTTYKNTPQLAIIILNDLPSEYSMDEYKLEQFNKYGVGTKDENHGMLFVFAINSRQYGFEIGDGFEQGTLLRADLEKDFVTSDMKDLLGQENYDEVVMQITKHLEQIMADEEAGVYVQKEQDYLIQQQEAAGRIDAFNQKLEKFNIIFFGSIVVIGFVACVIGIASCIIDHRKRKNKIKQQLEKHKSYVFFIKEKNDVLIEYLLNKQYTLAQLDESFLEYLYEYWLDREEKTLENKQALTNEVSEYETYLRKANDFTAFKEFRTKDLDTIIYETDKEIERVDKIITENDRLIDAFVWENKNKIPDGLISSDDLASNIKSRYNKSRKDIDNKEIQLLTDDKIESYFTKELNRLSFKREYDAFIKENADEINSEYFDSSEFYDSLRSTEQYNSYNYRHRNDFLWMYPLLMTHMHNREREIREEHKRQERLAMEQIHRMNNSATFNSSFGSSFGGGHSSGGGFKGGW